MEGRESVGDSWCWANILTDSGGSGVDRVIDHFWPVLGGVRRIGDRANITPGTPCSCGAVPWVVTE